MDQDFYISLIHQDLQGTLPEEGHSQLAEWRMADPEHSVLEQEVRKSWELSHQYEPELKVDVDAAFNSLRTRVRAHENEKTATVRALPPIRSNRRTWLGIAASMLLLLSAAWFFWPGQTGDGPMALIVTQPGDAPREITLSDGTKVWLRENSSLDYPESFSSVTRPVFLKGEAFFDVVKNPDVPFVVILGDRVQVEVLGTSFLVSAKEDAPVEVTVRTGKVELSAENERLQLFRGSAGAWNPATKELTRLPSQPNASAWQNNTLIFNDKPLPEVLQDVETHFNISINLTNNQLQNCRFGGRFPNADLAEILDAMQLDFGLTWEQTGNEYQLSDGSCE